ncbi:MAG TPA: hypothetical protein VJ302_25845 [Blastocatellia bacterium]|nr:hypothetical protein [Blastocatellia bacterium]
MEETYSIQRMLELRKLTRAIAELLRGQIRDYLVSLAPLYHPRTILGEYVQGHTKEVLKGAPTTFKELQALYDSIAPPKPFNISKELKSPLELFGGPLELTAVEYTHQATADQASKTVTVTLPLRWIVSYPGCSPSRLRELCADRNRSTDEVLQGLLHYLVLHLLMIKQTGLTRILEALHFSVHPNERLPGLGNMPVAMIHSSVSTVRPPDNVIIESTEISGVNAFEEVVNLADLSDLRDPLSERLIELVKSHGESL